jgi:hypothetical protein
MLGGSVSPLATRIASRFRCEKPVMEFSMIMRCAGRPVSSCLPRLAAQAYPELLSGSNFGVPMHGWRKYWYANIHVWPLINGLRIELLPCVNAVGIEVWPCAYG